MNTSAPASTGAAAGHAPFAQATGKGSPLRAQAGGAADLFAQLLLLMGADSEANTSGPLMGVADVADASGQPGGAPDPGRAQDEPQNPLNDPQPGIAQLIQPQPNHPVLDLPGWSGLPQTAWSHPGLSARVDDRAREPLGLDAGPRTSATTPTTTASPTWGPLPAPAPDTSAAATSQRAASPAAGSIEFATAKAPSGHMATALPELRTPSEPVALNADARRALDSVSTGPENRVGTPQPDTRLPAGAQVFAWRSTTTLASGTRTATAAAANATLAAAQAAASHAGADRTHAAGTTAQPVAGIGVASSSARAGAAAARETDSEPDATPASSSARDRADTRHDALAATTDTGAMASGTGDHTSGGEAGTQDARTPDEPTDRSHTSRADGGDDAAGPWGAQHLRHASVRVGDAGDSSIDIQLALDGQALQVAFNTNDEEARTRLVEDAGVVLGDLLERSGIELGGVSVGGQGPQARHDHPGQAPQPTRTGTGRQRPVAQDPPPPRTAAPATHPVRADGSRPLDLFA